MHPRIICLCCSHCVRVTAVRHGERNAPFQAAAGPARSQGRPEVMDGGGCASILRVPGKLFCFAQKQRTLPQSCFSAVWRKFCCGSRSMAVLIFKASTSSVFFSNRKAMGVGIYPPCDIPGNWYAMIGGVHHVMNREKFLVLHGLFRALADRTLSPLGSWLSFGIPYQVRRVMWCVDSQARTTTR